MGYDTHITRRDEWSDEGNDITLAEWKNYLEEAVDMRLDNFAEAETPDGQTIRIDSEGIAVWTGFSAGHDVWFDYHRGNITVKNANTEILRKMLEIADRFDAKVMGDEGELYTHASLDADDAPTAKKTRKWWQFWR